MLISIRFKGKYKFIRELFLFFLTLIKLSFRIFLYIAIDIQGNETREGFRLEGEKKEGELK